MNTQEHFIFREFGMLDKIDSEIVENGSWYMFIMFCYIQGNERAVYALV